MPYLPSLRPILILTMFFLTLTILLHPANIIEAAASTSTSRCFGPGHNCDVNRDNLIEEADATEIINYLNRQSANPDLPYESRFDTNRNGAITPLDALHIINFLNKPIFWQNPINRCDVNYDGIVAASDAALLSSYLDTNTYQVAYYDVTGDGSVTVDDTNILTAYLGGDLSTCPAPFTKTIRYVATDGNDSANDCTNSDTPCRTIQYAIDSSDTGDEVRIATGIYSDLHNRDGLTQVAYINKTLTIHGGYSDSNWSQAAPAHTPTIIDALDNGRGIVVTSNSTAIIADLTITGGHDSLGAGVFVDQSAPTLANLIIEENTALNAGGGIYLAGGAPILRQSIVRNNVTTRFYSAGVHLNEGAAVVENNLIEGNQADEGWAGGIYVWRSDDAIVRANDIRSNSAEHGAGIYLYESNIQVTENIISSNHAIGAGYGGGLYAYRGSPTVSNNTFQENEAGNGGGAAFAFSTAVARDNLFTRNTAGSGGGLMTYQSADRFEQNTLHSNSAHVGAGLSVLGGTATFSNTIVTHNRATEYGGGIVLAQAASAAFINSVISNNTIVDDPSYVGSAIYLSGSQATWAHPTITNNTGGSGSAVHVGINSSAEFSNAIFANHTLAIETTSGSADVAGVLWHNNTSNHSGNVTLVNEHSGDPLFAEDGYHLNSGSAAVDRALAGSVSADIDGEQRDRTPDFGADEQAATQDSFQLNLVAGWNLISLPVAQPSMNVVDLIAPLGNSVDLVRTYRACDTSDPWKTFDPSLPSFANDLTSLTLSDGVWIRMNAPATLTLIGTPAASTTTTLCANWNLTGYPALQAQSVTDAFASLDGNLVLARSYVAADVADPWKTYDPSLPTFANDLVELSPGGGYWVRVSNSADWTQP